MGPDEYPLMKAWKIQSDPPNKPIEMRGPSPIKPWINFIYDATATDPNEDDIRYLFNWSDGEYKYSDYVKSGEEGFTFHNWFFSGDYAIRVKAKDIYGYESEWSDPLLIHVGRNRTVNTFLGKLLLYR
jgi:hypothetical protein